jgi:lysophospholipase L1-like esterase
VLVGGAAVVGLLAAAIRSQGQPAGPSTSIRIMPLGDSLTEGTGSPGAYRIDLWSKLTSDGFNVEYVGSQKNGPPELSDRRHEGHPGWRIDQIAGWAPAWLRDSRPQVVLLMIGTNDVVQNYDLPAAPARLGNLIDQIARAAPEAAILVASIPRIDDPMLQQRVQAYNAAIPDIVSTRGGNLSFVDVFPLVAPSDLAPDRVHLRPSGNSKIASAWYAALKPILLARQSATETPR